MRSSARRKLASWLGLGVLVSAPQARGAEGVADAQAAALDRLRSRSAVPVRARFEGDRVPLLSLDVALRAAEDATPAERALDFLEAHADLYGLDDPRASLYVSRVHSDELGQHVFFDQQIDGMAVFGAQLLVHLDGDRVRATSGSYLIGRPPQRTPAVTAERAVEIALRHSGGGHRLVGSPRLQHLDFGVLGWPEDGEASPAGGNYLAWRLTLAREGSDSGAFHFVDALSGRVLASVPTDASSGPAAQDLWIRTVNRSGHTPFCGYGSATDWFDENGPVSGASPDAEGSAAFAAANDVYDFFFNTFHRHSWDGKERITAVNLDDGDPSMVGSGAAYVPSCGHFAFEDGFATLDVFAHEFTHGVTHSTANLIYANQSGALNESYSDVFAALIDTANWTIGETTSGGAIRNMARPSDHFGRVCIGTASSFTCGAVRHPDRMSRFVPSMNTADGDWGGVHTNSGIPNKAAHLIAAGGTHNGVTVTGIGRTKTAHLYHHVLTRMLGPSSNFQAAADLTLIAAETGAAAGWNGFTAADACAVRNALAAVELEPPDFNCDGILDVHIPDGDDDGDVDTMDNCPTVPNPSQANADTDGLGDACDPDADDDAVLNASDNCPLKKNASQTDFDKDGWGDACDDSDGDGVKDDVDNCRYKPNTNQANLDASTGDPFGDVCDKDLDGDGYCQVGGTTVGGETGVPPGGCPAAPDNCPRVPNASQDDKDQDGYGDACDTCPMVADSGGDQDGDGLASSCDPDDDGDGVADAQDNCPVVANPDQVDWNGNGIGRACDPTEQIKVESFDGARVSFTAVLREWLDRMQVIDIDIQPSPDDPFGCDWSSGDRSIEIAVTAGVPVVAAVVDHEGMHAALAPPDGRPILRFSPRADFCALPVGPRGSGDDPAGRAFLGRSYVLRLAGVEPLEPGQALRVELVVRQDVPGDLPPPGEPMAGGSK